MPAIVVFGELIARTAATSLVLVFILLPCLLVLFDKWIEKTTIGGAKFYIAQNDVISDNKGAEKEDNVSLIADNDDNTTNEESEVAASKGEEE